MKKLLLAIVLLVSVTSFAQQKTLEDYLYKTDKYTGEKYYYSNDIGDKIKLIKGTTPNKKDMNALAVTVYGNISEYSGKGLFILFENGQKIIRPDEDVDCKYSSSNDKYQYTVYLFPTDEEIEKIKSSKITEIKLYIFEDTVSDKIASKVLEASKIML